MAHEGRRNGGAGEDVRGLSDVFLVAGLSGVGKSSVVNSALAKVKGVVRVNFGDAILREALDEKLVKNRDELRLLDPEVQRRLQAKAAAKIGQMEGKVVVDTHLTIPTPDGYVPGIPVEILVSLNPKRIVILEADPGDILKRRILDRGRSRVDESLEQIEEHFDFDRAAAISMSIHVGSPVKIIRNDVVEEAGEELARIFR
jgi:adenylate kinase